MPFETMGQGSLSTSPCFLEEICFYSEKKLGFWKPKTMHYCHDGKVQELDSMSVVSTPLEELFPVGALAVDCLERPLSHVAGDHEEKLYIGGENRTPSFSISSGGHVNDRKESPNLYMQAISRTPSFSTASRRYVNNRNESPNLYMKAVSSSVDTNKTDIYGNRYGNCLSSSTLAEVFGRKTGLSTNNFPFHKPAGIVDSCHGEKESFGSTEDIVAQTIGDLLPDEDDLFSGLMDELEYIADAKRGDDGEDFDLFNSVGGMELEVDDDSCVGRKDSVLTGGVIIGRGNSNGSLVNALPYAEHPSRTLFVRNINSNVEDSVLRAHGGRPVGRFNIGTVQGLHSASHVPFNALTETVFSLGSSFVLNSLPSPLREASSGNCFGFHKPSHSMDQLEFGGKCLSSFHPFSSPDCQDNFNIFIPGNSSSTVTNMAGKIGSKASEGVNDQQTTMIGSNGRPVALKGGVSGPSGNDTCTVLGHHWSNSYSFKNHPLNPTIWPNSPLFSDDLNGSCSPQLHGYARVPPDMLNPFSPPHHIHVGSTPSVSPSFGDRQHAYTRESPESSAFCLAPVGNVGFLGHSPLHLLGRASHVFSHAAGNCMEKSTNDALHSPQQMSQNCPGRKPVTSLPTSFGSPREYGRNLSHRRNHGSSSHADKKQFELDIDRILCGEDSRTTLMIKNIPNKYTSKMLLSTIDEHCRGTYDFIYLPIDFKNKCNVGYAFVNLVDPFQIIPFFKAFNGRKWEKFNSEKVAALKYARIQGKAALVARFQNSSLMNEDKRCHPILFCTDGPNAGEQEPFPTGTNIRSRASKAHSIVNEENQHQRSPTSNSVD